MGAVFRPHNSKVNQMIVAVSVLGFNETSWEFCFIDIERLSSLHAQLASLLWEAYTAGRECIDMDEVEWYEGDWDYVIDEAIVTLPNESAKFHFEIINV
jgi:hypothetical protein